MADETGEWRIAGRGKMADETGERRRLQWSMLVTYLIDGKNGDVEFEWQGMQPDVSVGADGIHWRILPCLESLPVQHVVGLKQSGTFIDYRPRGLPKRIHSLHKTTTTPFEMSILVKNFIVFNRKLLNTKNLFFFIDILLRIRAEGNSTSFTRQQIAHSHSHNVR